MTKWDEYAVNNNSPQQVIDKWNQYEVTPKSPIQAYREKFAQRVQETEQRIAGRKGAVQTLIDELNYIPNPLEHPIDALMKQPTLVSKILNVPLEKITSPIASAGLDIQKGDYNQILLNMLKAIKGQRVPSMSDIPQTAGINPILSQLIGLGSEAGILSPMTAIEGFKGLGNIPKTAGEAGAEIKTGVKAIQDFAKPVTGKISEAYSKIAESFKAGKELKNVTGQISEIESKVKNLSTIQGLKEVATDKTVFDLKNELRTTQYGKKSTLQDLENTFKQGNQVLNNNLKKETILQAGANKKILTGIFKDMSTTYRNGIEKAEDVLIQQGKTITNQDYLTKVVNKTIDELKLRAIPEDSTAFKTLDNLKTGLGGNTKNMSLDELKNLKNGIYDTLSAGVKSGSKYGEIDDQVANIFLKNHGDFIGEMSPELVQLNKEFAPMANARAWAMKSFRPYNIDDIQKGANILERIAKSDVPNQTDLNYLKHLEEGSGRFAGAGELKGKTVQMGKEIKLYKQNFDLAKKNLIDATDYKINQLQNQIAEVPSKFKLFKADIAGQEKQLGFQRDTLLRKTQDLKDLIKLRKSLISIGVTGVLLGGTTMGRRIIHSTVGGW